MTTILQALAIAAIAGSFAFTIRTSNNLATLEEGMRTIAEGLRLREEYNQRDHVRMQHEIDDLKNRVRELERTSR